MDCLKLKATVEEVKPLRTVDVHGRAQHLLSKGLMDTEIRRAHREMRQRDLHMQRRSESMADEHEPKPTEVVWHGFIDDTVAVPSPKHHHASHLIVSMPPRRSLLWPFPAQKILQRQPVQVEASEQHNRVVRVMLNAHQDLSRCIVFHDPLVVCRSEALQEAVSDSEYRDVLDIWIVFWVIRDQVVNIVVELPPARTQAAEIGCNGHSNGRVGRKVVCDTHVTGIMDRESELVPDASKRNRTRDIPSRVESVEEQGSERPVPQTFHPIVPVSSPANLDTSA